MKLQESRRNAQPVQASLYKHHPNFFSRFCPKLHPMNEVANFASLRCQQNIFGQKNVGKVCGSLAPEIGNATALMLPNCANERLDLVSYFLELCWIKDDIMDAEVSTDSRISQGDVSAMWGHKIVEKLKKTFLMSVWKVRLAIALRETVKAFIKQDPVLGTQLLRELKGWVRCQKTTALEVSQSENIDQLLEARRTDSALCIMIPLMRYANKSKILPEDLIIVDAATSAIAYSSMLTNDLLSYHKESRSDNTEISTEDHNICQSNMANAVSFYRNTKQLSAEEAKREVRIKIDELEAQYVALKADVASKATNWSSQRISAISLWWEDIECLVSGLNIWSLYSARYQKTDKNAYNTFKKKDK